MEINGHKMGQELFSQSEQKIIHLIMYEMKLQQIWC